MIKKLSLVALLVLGLTTLVYADATVTSATNARAAAQDKGLEMVVGIGDVSSGSSLEVDSEGSLSVKQYPGTVGTTLATADQLLLHTSGKNLVSGAARLQKIIYGGVGAVAGQYVLVYDALTATGTPVLEVSIGTAQSTVVVDLGQGGMTFGTGITVKSGVTSVNDGTSVTIMYDN